MWIAKRQGFCDAWDYFQNNLNDSPKWTTLKSKAGRFATKEEALSSSNPTGLYEIVLEEV